MRFSDRLESVDPKGVTLTDLHDLRCQLESFTPNREAHFAKATFTNNLEQLKAVNSKRYVLSSQSGVRISKGGKHEPRPA